MAANNRSLVDDHRDFSDWIELRNLGPTPVNLDGWKLSAHPRKPDQWLLPPTNLPPGGLLLLRASGRDQRIPGRPLHTNFKLARDGDYLALRQPDGTLATEFAPKYPPQFPDASFGFLPGSTQAVVFVTPTPGRPNESAKTRPGPRIASVTHSPAKPRPGQSLQVLVTLDAPPTAELQVTLHWRAQFEPEQSLAMSRTPQGSWSATLPLEHATAGQMVRWRVVVQDPRGGQSIHPPTTHPKRTSKYLGTVIAPDSVRSPLPVFHLFLAPSDIPRADSESGAYGCFFHGDEFYDNVMVKVRGNTTAFFPKRSHRLEFPVDHPLRHPGPGGRIRHTSLMAEFLDPTYLRQHLSFWLLAETGSAAPFHDPVRVQLNGEFWQLAMHSQVLGEELLQRHGLDPHGALYKAVGTLTPDFNSTGGFEKKTRREEDTADYSALARALGDRQSLAARRRALFDRMNLPATINYLAVARLTQEDDDIWANMSLYHDNDGTGEWRPIPFDMNVSWGFSFAHGGIIANQDRIRSHPFFGASDTGMTQGHNRLYDAIVAVPETRHMLLRRMRTILDQWWQPPGTPIAERIIERHLADLARRMAPDAALDQERWGGRRSARGPLRRGSNFDAGIQDLIQQFIEPRRVHFYVTHSVTNASLRRPLGITERHTAGIPLPQPDRLRLDFAALSTHPTNARLDHLTLTNIHPEAVDISGWRLTGRVAFTFPPGTVLPPHGLLHVAADVTEFRRHPAAVPTKPPHFVVGNLRGQLTNNTPLTLVNTAGKPAAILSPTAPP